MISIVVPVYNTAAYLSRCIDSILAQSYREWRLLLVDDGSTDNSAQICQDYSRADSRIRYYRKDNGGAADSRNFGIEKVPVESQWIVFCDSDDTVESNYLSTLLENSHGVDSVICGMNDIYGDRKSFSPLMSSPSIDCADPFSNTELLGLLRKGVLNSPCDKLYKSEIIRNHSLRFDTQVYNEDITFNVEYFSYCQKIRIISAGLYNYHHRLGSITSAPPESAFKDYMSLQQSFCEKVTDGNKHYVLDFVSYQYTGLILRLLKKKDYVTARKYLKEPLIYKAMCAHTPYSSIDRAQNLMLRHRWLRLYAKLFLR